MTSELPSIPCVVPNDVPFSDHDVDVAGLTLRYRIWGDREKPVVFLQHGGKDHGRSWDWVVAQLVADYCLVVPDIRGHGNSDWVPGGGYEALEYVSDFAIIVDHVIEQGLMAPFSLVGHSLGGNVVLRYAALFPENVTRVLSEEGIGLTQAMYDHVMNQPTAERWKKAVSRRVSGLLSDRRVFPSLDKALLPLRKVHPTLNEEMLQYIAVHGLKAAPGGWQWKYDPVLSFSGFRPESPSDYRAIFEKVHCPVKIIVGGASPLGADAESRASAFPNAEVITYEGAGHWLHHEQPDRFIDDVRAFLRGE